MRIAICDDDFSMATQVENLIEMIYPESQMFNCDVFLSAEALIDKIENNNRTYQIYLLDIEMKEIDGLTLAKYIRKTDMEAVIIFITSHQIYMQEAFDVQAFHYLIKPIDELKVKNVILKAIDLLSTNQMIFQFKQRKYVQTLFVKNIEYFESYKRKIDIHTIDGIETFYGNLRDVMKQLPETLFAQTHISFIVNLEKVVTIKGDKVIMVSGAQVNISRKFVDSFNKTYRQFVLLRCLK